MRSIAVLGSLNADLVTRMDRYPSPGETVVARSFAQFFGGKRASLAVAQRSGYLSKYSEPK